MSIVICVLDDDHPFEHGDTIIQISRLQKNESGEIVWVKMPAMLMEHDEAGIVTPIKVGVGERLPKN